MPEITVIGLGNMGGALAVALLKAGRNIAAWNRRHRLEVDQVVQAGGKIENDIHAAVAASPVLLLCTLDYATIFKILEPVDTANKLWCQGKTVINLSTGTPSDVRAMDQWIRERGAARYFDGSIMVEPTSIGMPHSVIFCSGESEDALADSGVREILLTFGEPAYFGPASDEAATIDMAMLAGLSGMWHGALHSLALLKKNLDRRPVDSSDRAMTLESIATKYLNPFLLAVMTYHVKFARALDLNDPDRNDNVPMAMASTGSTNIIRACKEEGVDGATFEHFNRIMWKTVDEYGPDCGLARTVSLLVRGEQDT